MNRSVGWRKYLDGRDDPEPFRDSPMWKKRYGASDEDSEYEDDVPASEED